MLTLKNKQLYYSSSIIIFIIFTVFIISNCGGDGTGFINPPVAAEPSSTTVPSPTASTGPVTPTSTPGSIITGLVQPSDLVYKGAFRLPEGSGGTDWTYSGAAMACYPGGDRDGPSDGYGGSIFATGHPYLMYVSEITIPVPVISSNINELNTANTLQTFHDVRGGLFSEADGFDQAFLRVGLEYLPQQGEQTTDKLYFSWGQHLQEGQTGPSHTWCELNLSSPQIAGPWAIAGRENYSTNDYIFAIPDNWASINTPGKLLATGRFRDGGQGGQGPSIYAIGPWSQGNPPPAGTELENIPLLQYETAYTSGGHTINNYHQSDEWNGGAWLTSGSKSAVIFAGTKGTGTCWYGFADGTVWPDEPPYPPEGEGERGWWSTGFKGQIIFYNPSDLASVAKKTMEPYEPQPYAVMDIDNNLFHIQSGQQKYHTGAVSFDRGGGYLYVMEPFADGEKPVIHVWKVN
jgi:hypothetical protein